MVGVVTRSILEERASCTPAAASGQASLSDVERVSRRADGADGIVVVFGIQGAAQASYVHVDRARLDIDVRAPDRVEQLFAGEHPPWVLHEIVEETKLGGAEM